MIIKIHNYYVLHSLTIFFFFINVEYSVDFQIKIHCRLNRAQIIYNWASVCLAINLYRIVFLFE